MFNWNLSLREYPSCTGVISFPLFWHLTATSVKSSPPAPGAGSSALLTQRGCKSAATPELHRCWNKPGLLSPCPRVYCKVVETIFLYKLNRQQPEREERGRILGICRDFSAHNSLLGKNKFSRLPLLLTLSQPEGPAISLPSKIYSLELTLCVLSSCYAKIW